MTVYPDLASRPHRLMVSRDMVTSAQALYHAWTEGFDSWFAEPGTVSMRAEVNQAFFFETEFGGGRHPHYGRFLTLEPDRHVELTWVTLATHGAETVVDVKLLPAQDATRLELTHSGFPDKETMSRHADAWPLVLDQLDERLGDGDARRPPGALVEAHVRDLVAASPPTVFEAIADPKQISGYFASRAEGRPEAGGTVRWFFDDVGGQVDVRFDEVVANERLSFTWPASGTEQRVKIVLAPHDSGGTLVDITEGQWPRDQQGVEAALEQKGGWTDFVCSMKAYLACGVRLREGRSAETH
jgi:uncharacterized protein YndB with AHSA1/START domain